MPAPARSAVGQPCRVLTNRQGSGPDEARLRIALDDRIHEGQRPERPRTHRRLDGSGRPGVEVFPWDGSTGHESATTRSGTAGVRASVRWNVIALAGSGRSTSAVRKAVRRAVQILDRSWSEVRLGGWRAGVRPGVLKRLVQTVRLERGERALRRCRNSETEIENLRRGRTRPTEMAGAARP